MVSFEAAWGACVLAAMTVAVVFSLWGERRG
jgi:hypothetical protein